MRESHSVRHRCFYCPADFPNRSSIFDHLESAECSSGATAFGMAATVAGIQEADGVVYCMPPVIASGITIFGNGPEDLVGELYECLECEITFQELGDLFRHLETTGKCRWLLTHSQRMGGLIDSLREHLYVDPEEG